ncbi:DUF3343 domain-containing protein [Guggenheimella bovis]
MVLVSFDTSFDALLLEKACKKHSVEGKLIPVPREVSSGCGMAWVSDDSLKEKVLELIERYEIEVDKVLDYKG